DLFTQGITASFNSYSAQLAANGVDPTSALATYLATANWAQYPATGTTDQKIRYIITQKWFSMCGNEGFEAWTEWRRTGYPDFFTVSQSSLIGQNFPRRFLYPFSEVTRNANFPGLVPVTTPVWWDVN
ncbi:MAG TPA: SusD/RagB family nutrient-binding outer membrane lipoprotein, partial [Candidatus Babeliaceae bacterium]|nr:SusD/RagB family nutrient-binding outer membrane lipoprotein [Candidatus Babeliaceae bacterium]